MAELVPGFVSRFVHTSVVVVVVAVLVVAAEPIMAFRLGCEFGFAVPVMV